MMSFRKTCLSLGFASVFASVLANPALADTTVRAFLWNAPNITEMADNLGIGMAGDANAAQFGVSVSTLAVPAGKVTFEVLNASADMEHEMVVAPVGADGALPMNTETSRVDEDLSAALGEVAEIEPGAVGTLTLDMVPGKYVLFCNLPGHYLGGMWVILTVV